MSTVNGAHAPASGPGAGVRQALDAARRLEALGHEDPLVLAYAPVAATNPYQALLYVGAWDRGIAPVPLARFDEIAGLALLPRRGIRTVLHLHWTGHVLRTVPDADSADRAIATFLGSVDRFLDAGGRLVWTVHNVLPHDARLAEHEARLQQAIVDRATAVHVLTERTPAAADGIFTIPPDRVFHVPHPSYAGAYQDLVSRDQARQRLRLGARDTVYLLFGAIKPYKGLQVLQQAFAAVAAEAAPRRRRLLVAGRADRAPETADFLRRCATDPAVTVVDRRLEDSEVQVFLRASDVAVLPYGRHLNSGVLMLALTFGLPVVVPEHGAGTGMVTPAVARTFEAGNAESLADALRAADELLAPDARPGVRSAALWIADEHAPAQIAERFATELLRRLADAAPADDQPGVAIAPDAPSLASDSTIAR